MGVGFRRRGTTKAGVDSAGSGAEFGTGGKGSNGSCNVECRRGVDLLARKPSPFLAVGLLLTFAAECLCRGLRTSDDVSARSATCVRGCFTARFVDDFAAEDADLVSERVLDTDDSEPEDVRDLFRRSPGLTRAYCGGFWEFSM